MSRKHFDFWPAGLPRGITLPATNLFYNAEVSAPRYPDKPFLIFFEAPLTFAQFRDEAERLAGHLQQDCGVGPSDRETMKAVVVLRAAHKVKVTEEEIIEWTRRNMATYKHPRMIEFVDALPKSATGKVQWRLLQEAELARACPRASINGKQGVTKRREILCRPEQQKPLA